MRTVEIHLDPMQYPDVFELNKTVGYLAMWSMDFYDKVVFMPDLGWENCFIAHYSGPEGKPTYTIGAVWDKDLRVFSLHS